MKLHNNKSGFTLLEIIIVIIIIGVLASLALPRLLKTVEYSRATEALAQIGTIKSRWEECGHANEAIDQGDVASGSAYTSGTPCDTFLNIGMDDPSNAAGNPQASFDYTFASPWPFHVIASRVSPNPAYAGQTIDFTYLPTASPSTTKIGSGPYSGLK
jgi:prepilin-type N-terminal cleavage/methylation domain-containing protein